MSVTDGETEEEMTAAARPKMRRKSWRVTVSDRAGKYPEFMAILVEELTEDRMRAIARGLIDRAQAGDLDALFYLLGEEPSRQSGKDTP